MHHFVRNSLTLESAVVVGDDPAMRRLTAAILRQQGLGVTEVRSLAEATLCFRLDASRIVLLVAGLDVAADPNSLPAVLRLVQRHPHLRAILTSTSTPNKLAIGLMQAAGIQFLSLPCSFARFSRSVVDHISGDRPRNPELPADVMLAGRASTDTCAAYS